jgi:hypothetical protein
MAGKSTTPAKLYGDLIESAIRKDYISRLIPLKH